MARKSVGYTKLIWICPNCQTRNPGPKKVCSTCGNPQPQDVQFIQADKEDLIQDAEKLSRVKKSPDIHCPYCGTRNAADSKICSQCGGKLKGGKKRASGKVVGTHKKDSSGVKCAACGYQNIPNAPRCANCGNSLNTVKKKTVKKTLKKDTKVLWLVIGFVLAIVLGFIIFKSCSRSAVLGVVEQTNWTRTVAVEQFVPVSHDGWWDDIPADAYVSVCEERFRYASDKPQEDSIEVCGEPYTIDEGTGYGEVVQDCEYQVFDTYCEYEVSEWAVVEILETDGYGTNASWPAVSAFSDQRAGEQNEEYTIWFETPEGSVSFKTEDYSIFNSANAGSEWDLVFDGFGNIREISPK